MRSKIKNIKKQYNNNSRRVQFTKETEKTKWGFKSCNSTSFSGNCEYSTVAKPQKVALLT